jgi:hypothetical protein
MGQRIKPVLWAKDRITGFSGIFSEMPKFE